MKGKGEHNKEKGKKKGGFPNVNLVHRQMVNSRGRQAGPRESGLGPGSRREAEDQRGKERGSLKLLGEAVILSRKWGGHWLSKG